MEPVKAPNCWLEFLRRVVDAAAPTECSTENENWRDGTNEWLAKKKLFALDVYPGSISCLPGDQLVGAVIKRAGRKAHVVTARVSHPRLSMSSDLRQQFIVVNDPLGQFPERSIIIPDSIVLICKIILK
jgi:hypothetical protein